MDFQLGPSQSRESRECPLRDAIPMVAHAVVCSVETGKYRKSEDISKFLSEGRLGLAQPGHPNYALRQIYDLLDSLNITNSPLAGVVEVESKKRPSVTSIGQKRGDLIDTPDGDAANDLLTEAHRAGELEADWGNTEYQAWLRSIVDEVSTIVCNTSLVTQCAAESEVLDGKVSTPTSKKLAHYILKLGLIMDDVLMMSFPVDEVMLTKPGQYVSAIDGRITAVGNALECIMSGVFRRLSEAGADPSNAFKHISTILDRKVVLNCANSKLSIYYVMLNNFSKMAGRLERAMEDFKQYQQLDDVLEILSLAPTLARPISDTLPVLPRGQVTYLRAVTDGPSLSLTVDGLKGYGRLTVIPRNVHFEPLDWMPEELDPGLLVHKDRSGITFSPTLLLAPRAYSLELSLTESDFTTELAPAGETACGLLTKTILEETWRVDALWREFPLLFAQISSLPQVSFLESQIGRFIAFAPDNEERIRKACPEILLTKASPQEILPQFSVDGWTDITLLRIGDAPRVDSDLNPPEEEDTLLLRDVIPSKCPNYSALVAVLDHFCVSVESGKGEGKGSHSKFHREGYQYTFSQRFAHGDFPLRHWHVKNILQGLHIPVDEFVALLED